MEIQDSYRSVAARAEGLFKDNGSRFIAFICPVETEEEVRDLVSAFRKEYHDARHHCYAYRPILGQIDSAGLSDVAVVVVRYFGGIKLGIPGLIRAYKSSTADAIAHAQVVEKVAGRHYRLEFGYLSMNPVQKVLKDMDLPQSGQDFGERCSLVVRVRLSLEEAFLDRVAKIEDCACKPI